MKIELLAEILEDKGLGEIGVSIFAHGAPDAAEMILFRLPLQGVPVDHEIPGRYRHKLQVIVRGAKTGKVEERAAGVSAALTMQSRVLEGMVVDFIRPITLPIIYPRAEGSSDIEASINFDCCYVLD